MSTFFSLCFYHTLKNLQKNAIFSQASPLLKYIITGGKNIAEKNFQKLLHFQQTCKSWVSVWLKGRLRHFSIVNKNIILSIYQQQVNYDGKKTKLLKGNYDAVKLTSTDLKCEDMTSELEPYNFNIKMLIKSACEAIEMNLIKNNILLMKSNGPK